MNTKILTSSLIAIIASLSVSIAHADEARLSTKVSYADLNLDSPKGVQALMSRIQGAARFVCSPLAGVGVDAHVRYSSCYDQAMSDAVRGINKPTVTAKYLQAKNGSQG